MCGARPRRAGCVLAARASPRSAAPLRRPSRMPRHSPHRPVRRRRAARPTHRVSVLGTWAKERSRSSYATRTAALSCLHLFAGAAGTRRRRGRRRTPRSPTRRGGRRSSTRLGRPLSSSAAFRRRRRLHPWRLECPRRSVCGDRRGFRRRWLPCLQSDPCLIGIGSVSLYFTPNRRLIQVTTRHPLYYQSNKYSCYSCDPLGSLAGGLRVRRDVVVQLLRLRREVALERGRRLTRRLGHSDLQVYQRTATRRENSVGAP
jgi:hypothetical protein